MLTLAIVSFLCALLPAILYARNVLLFRPPPEPLAERVCISVLIPARNEEAGIAACLEHVLASQHTDLDVIVLDDHSTDATAEIVREIAKKDSRLRLESSPTLPSGWSGKQHACYTLSQLAKHELLVFLDADVRVRPEGFARMAAFQRASGAAIVSGFPRQETETLLERLLIPLIHFVLLGFLPFSQMRHKVLPGLGAGCGQWFLTTASAYRQVGGHSHLSVRGSFHDGVKLPRAYRVCGLMTDLCDVTQLATCRMYRSASQVWNGLAKNAREGLGAPKMLLFATTLLYLGQIWPWWVTLNTLLLPPLNLSLILPRLAILMMLAVRLDAARRFQQSWLGAILHPVGVAAFLAVQWYANLRAAIGRPVGWKGRTQTRSS
jgi:Glycosyl transferase family 2